MVAVLMPHKTKLAEPMHEVPIRFWFVAMPKDDEMRTGYFKGSSYWGLNGYAYDPQKVWGWAYMDDRYGATR